MADDYELGTVGPIPTVNPNVAKIGELLNAAKTYANQYYVKDYVPLIGGTQLGDMLLGQAPEEIQRWGQGDYPVRNPSEVTGTGGNRLDIWKTGRFEPTFDVATNVVAPTIGAAKLTKGLPVGLSMMGPESKLWNKEMAFNAGKMEAKGATPEEIHKATGMARGLDNQWRMELSDKFAKMKQGETFDEIHRRGGLNGIWAKENVLVKDVLEHPELMEAYPHLGDIKVKTHKADNPVRGSYNQKKNEISIREDLNPEEAKSVMLHELTHGIQAKE